MPDPGSWPDWAAAGIAFLALVTGAIAAWATVRTNQTQGQALSLQQAQLDELERDRRREQAARVSIWIDDNHVKVSNYSNLPIYNVFINTREKDFEDWIFYWVSDVLHPAGITHLSSPVVSTGAVRVEDIANLVGARVIFLDCSRRPWSVSVSGSIREFLELNLDYLRDRHGDAVVTDEDLSR